MQPQRALTSTAHAEQTGWRKGQDLIDALPYVDALTPEEKQAVDKLIEEEMRRGTKRPADYLKELPPIPAPLFAGDEILENEVARVEAGEKMAGMDTKRYNLDAPPAAKRNDVAAWRQALDNAYSQLEHQYNRLLNLELLLKFGPDTWRMHNESLASLVKQLQEELVATRRQIEGLNRERKLQQTAAGRELSKLEEEYLGLVHKNMDIEAACRQVEREIAAAQEALGLRGDGAGAQAGAAAPADGAAGAATAGGDEEGQGGAAAAAGSGAGAEQQAGAGQAGKAAGRQAAGSSEGGAAEGPLPAADDDAMQD